MSRPKRNLQSGFCYHITTRCNNREFRLTRLECREVFLYAIKKAMFTNLRKRYMLHFTSRNARKEEIPKGRVIRAKGLPTIIKGSPPLPYAELFFIR